MGLSELLSQKRKEREKKAKLQATKKLVKGATVGLLAGLASGLLFSPKSGKDNREEIVNSAKELAKVANEKVEETKVNLTEAKEKIAKYIEEKKNSRTNHCCCEETITSEVETTIQGEPSTKIENCIEVHTATETISKEISKE